MDKYAYKTVKNGIDPVVLKEKGSKFLGMVFPVRQEVEIEEILNAIKSEHIKANHCCYAWQLGFDPIRYRTHDDGEPTNSAGMPIYGQIQAYDVTDVLVVVVRYFGGTKLGVGGLIKAYRNTAEMALAEAKIITRTQKSQLLLTFDYPQMDNVIKAINRYKGEILERQMEMSCAFTVSIKKKDKKAFLEYMKNLHEVEIGKLGL